MANTGYWVICIKSYDYDGLEISKGTMDYYTSLRPIVNPDWRRATEIEIQNKKNFNGKVYLPPSLWTF